jgi:broad specificity phosphatase PhoE
MPRLILLRHGQSQWNLENRFTGWVDVDLTAEGEAQARRGGELIAEAGFRPAVMFTSVLTRAKRTGALALQAAGLADVPVIADWRLNERHYGALQGKDKQQTHLVLKVAVVEVEKTGEPMEDVVIKADEPKMQVTLYSALPHVNGDPGMLDHKEKDVPLPEGWWQ